MGDATRKAFLEGRCGGWLHVWVLLADRGGFAGVSHHSVWLQVLGCTWEHHRGRKNEGGKQLNHDQVSNFSLTTVFKIQSSPKIPL